MLYMTNDHEKIKKKKKTLWFIEVMVGGLKTMIKRNPHDI